MAIRFHEEDTKRQKIGRKIIKDWIKKEILRRKKIPGEINIIFTSDYYLRKINREYLKRDYYTDIISFDYSDEMLISGDMFISTERVRENAAIYNVEYNNELFRVIIHGILHLTGYKDDTDKEKKIMREEENISIRNLLKKNE